GQAYDAREQRKRIQQPEERAGVVHALVGIEMERQALQQITEGDAKDEGRHRTTDAQPPVPDIAPARIVHLASVLDTDRAEEQREERQDQRHVESGKCRRVDERPGRKRPGAGGYEPDLVAFPRRPDGVDHDAALDVAAAVERQERPDPEIEAVEYRKANQQNANEQPPDKLQRRIVEGVDHDAAPAPAAASA